jgi:hypothetical protein
MRNFRVVAGGVIVCGYLFASGMFVGGAAAQTTESVGGPMQLLQLLKPGRAAEVKPRSKPTAKPHAKLAAKPVAKSSAKSSAKFSAKSSIKSSAKTAAKTRIASRKKLRSHIMVAERKRHQLQSAVQVAETPASDNAWPAAPTATPVDAATLAPVPQTPSAPQIVAPVAGATPSELVVDGQTIQVASADEANAIDLAANDASAVASDASLGPVTASNAAMTEVADPAVKSEPTSAAVAQAQGADVSSTSWFLQAMAALGGAVAAGSVAWFLIGSAPQRMYG